MSATSIPIKQTVLSGQLQWTDYDVFPAGHTGLRAGNLALDEDIRLPLRRELPENIIEHLMEEVIQRWTDPILSATKPLTSVRWTIDWPQDFAVREVAATWLQQAQPSLGALVERVVEQSAWILDLPHNWDDEGALPYEQTTWDRMKAFLLEWARDYRRYEARNIPLPAIDPADSASIDLFWNLSTRRLLANVPAAPHKPITFFGKDQSGVSISGKINRDEDAGLEHYQKAISYLTGWLATHG